MKTVTVVAAIIYNDDKILCVQRPKNKYSYISEKFEFPGGKIEEGETEVEALTREIKEELSLDISIRNKFLTVEHDYPDFRLIMHSYICEAVSRKVNLSEHIDMKWLRSEEIDVLDWDSELLFINLIKSEENFSPTTMYDDYAINELLFHWQSQNSAGPETQKGRSYIDHQDNKKKILLFIREKANDEFGNTMGYVFVGEGNLEKFYGSKPMSIKWKLNEPLPHYLWKDAAKLRIG